MATNQEEQAASAKSSKLRATMKQDGTTPQGFLQRGSFLLLMYFTKFFKAFNRILSYRPTRSASPADAAGLHAHPDFPKNTLEPSKSGLRKLELKDTVYAFYKNFVM